MILQSLPIIHVIIFTSPTKEHVRKSIDFHELLLGECGHPAKVLWENNAVREL